MTTSNSYFEAKRFIETLFPHYFKDHDGYVELRMIGKTVVPKWLPRGEITEADWEEISSCNKTHHVYFGVNPRPLSKEKKQEDIRDLVCLWADVDGKDFAGGGKEAALKSISDFPLPPSIIVDSGHGYHCYWVLKEPIISITKEQRVQFKQTLAGVVGRLGADSSKLHLDSCLRLPGTFNIKDPEPTECRVIQLKKEKTYKLEDFAEFKDSGFREPEEAESELPAFGKKQLIISLKDADSAQADVKRLEIDSRSQNRIMTGTMLTAKDADKTRSGRDMSILYHLISGDYDYATIKSVFFNPFLGCSNRMKNKGESALQWDTRRALEFVQRSRIEGTPGSRRILEIKAAFSGEERRRMIANFILGDLLSGQNPACYGLQDKEQRAFYLFDKKEKTLMSLESIDFYCFIRMRYGISRRDFEEINDVVMTEIWANGSKVKPHKFAYFDSQRFVLYVSNHMNQVYCLDGEKIELCDNGTDSVFFESDPVLAPYAFDPQLKVINYFEGDALSDKSGLAISGWPTGLSMSRFSEEASLLNEYLVDRVSFIKEKDNIVSSAEQKLLLVIFFYSLFFESILQEKPIACFIGKKESGKSFVATSIGKILFGERYESCHFPENADDLKTTLGRNYYLVFDNLDQYISDDKSNILCVAATGGTVTKRKLYTDSDEARYTPHCFLVITSRAPKFKRDDLVSRLLLFNTQKIGKPRSRSALFSTLLAARDSIMTEVLTNLNTVVKILKQHKDFEPRCISRIADWEVFGRKACGFPARFTFRLVLQMMNEKKDKFSIEDDYLYLILTRIVYEKGRDLIEKSPSELYSTLFEEAKDMKLSLQDFQRRYKNSRSVGQRLAEIKEELGRELEVEIYKHPGGQRTYTFMKKIIEVDTGETPESGSTHETEPAGSPAETDEVRLVRKTIAAKIRRARLSSSEQDPKPQDGESY